LFSSSIEEIPLIGSAIKPEVSKSKTTGRTRSLLFLKDMVFFSGDFSYANKFLKSVFF
jgi:hypothetical protein